MAQLVAQANAGFINFRDAAAQDADLLFQPGAKDADFTGKVDEVVNQVGRHAQYFGALNAWARFLLIISGRRSSFFGLRDGDVAFILNGVDIAIPQITEVHTSELQAR